MPLTNSRVCVLRTYLALSRHTQRRTDARTEYKLTSLHGQSAPQRSAHRILYTLELGLEYSLPMLYSPK